MYKHNNTNHAFTLIETLVAITILMIAIAGPLTVANRAYHTALESRDRIIATNLAQETIEYINYWKNNRNNDKPNNTFVGWEPNSFVVPQAFTECQDTKRCTVGLTPAGFDRKYFFTNQDGQTIDKHNSQAIVHVVVWWGDIDNSSKRKEIELVTVLTNSHR